MKTDCQHTFTIKQLRQDSKNSIVFYPDIGHSGHSDATFQCLRLSRCPTSETASTEVLLTRVAWIVPTFRQGLAWHRDEKPFRKLRHQAYVGRERAINWLAEQFRPPLGMTTVVGRVCRVVVVDEHRSSKLCCAWHATLHAHQYERVRNREEKLVDVWDTKRCVNKGCRVHVVNRDVNGAANMLMLTKCFFANTPRPTTFGGPSASPSFPPTLPPTRFAIRGNQLRQRYPVHGNKLLATGASPVGEQGYSVLSLSAHGCHPHSLPCCIMKGQWLSRRMKKINRNQCLV
ncbi:hypothetical protein F751_4557 [Auxenochlorella protothecoides]|uniref:Uncharacterized protein n=1 Tax=Auxenochlorella protothecoides TaxID=3075 RepID=A0A087SNI3_AUXPR|nr:hypothetical protein F751_4557 [Auxenochlorella protothecoides]KFM27287.1 hypothetical protein F751_4557 [Auxenochlorella protothecoides]